MKSLVAILWLMFAVAAQAQTATFAWDSYTDACTGFKLYQSKVSGSYSPTPTATFTPCTLTTGMIPKPSVGQYYYVLTAYYVDTSVTPNVTLESGQSNEVQLKVTGKPPKLNSAMLAAIQAPVKAIKWALGIRDKGLRIVS